MASVWSSSHQSYGRTCFSLLKFLSQGYKNSFTLWTLYSVKWIKLRNPFLQMFQQPLLLSTNNQWILSNFEPSVAFSGAQRSLMNQRNKSSAHNGDTWQTSPKFSKASFLREEEENAAAACALAPSKQGVIGHKPFCASQTSWVKTHALLTYTSSFILVNSFGQDSFLCCDWRFMRC